MDDMMYKAMALIVQALGILIVSTLIPSLKKLIKDKRVAKIIDDAVYATQQLHYDETGAQRKQHAVDYATEALNQAGIKIDSGQLSGLIEAAVMGMNIAKGKYQFEDAEIVTEPVKAEGATEEKA